MENTNFFEDILEEYGVEGYSSQKLIQEVQRLLDFQGQKDRKYVFDLSDIDGQIPQDIDGHDGNILFSNFTEDMGFVIDKAHKQYGESVNSVDAVVVIFYNDFKQYKRFDKSAIEKGLRRRAKKEYSLTRNSLKLAVEPHFMPNSGQDFSSIRISNRLFSLEKSKLIGASHDQRLVGSVYQAKLYDLVEIYKNFGDDLFQRNVRLGIGDKLNVDEAIKDTTENDDQMFWFLNNGISMIVDDISLIDKHLADRIQITNHMLDSDNSDALAISIINGAQTISSASQVDNLSQDIDVILRIYTFESIGDINSASRKSLSNVKKIRRLYTSKITIALNRQKPINADDIGYTTKFVDFINSVLPKMPVEEEFRFSLMRRGETVSVSDHAYHLIDFARIVKAYLNGYPGIGRSGTRKILLQTENPKSSSLGEIQDSDEPDFLKFHDTQLFLRQDQLDNPSSYCKTVFLRFYKPVNFAFSLFKFMNDEVLKSERLTAVNDSSDPNSGIVKYGRYLLLAIYLRLLIGASVDDREPDFSSWKATRVPEKKSESDKVKDDIVKLIKKFVLFCSATNQKNPGDSNFYKGGVSETSGQHTEKLFTDFYTYLQKNNVTMSFRCDKEQ